VIQKRSRERHIRRIRDRLPIASERKRKQCSRAVTPWRKPLRERGRSRKAESRRIFRQIKSPFSSRGTADCLFQSLKGIRKSRAPARRSREAERDDRKRVSVSLFSVSLSLSLSLSLSSFLFFCTRAQRRHASSLWRGREGGRVRSPRSLAGRDPSVPRGQYRFRFNFTASRHPSRSVTGELYFAGSRFTTGPRGSRL